MKICIKAIAFSILTAILFLSSCKEVVIEPEVIPDPICYLTTYNEDGEVTNYVYDEDNQVKYSIYNSDTTVFEYSNGNPIKAVSPYNEYTFEYTNGDFPSKILISKEGKPAGLVNLEMTNGNLTRVETLDAKGTPTEATKLVYTEGKLTSIVLQEWDDNSKRLIDYLTISDIVTDDKKNPFNASVALFLDSYDTPFALGKSNLLTANVVVEQQVSPVSITYTYNENNFPLTSSFNIFAETFTSSFVYNCK